jgi:alanyl-tRNA synthetase
MSKQINSSQLRELYLSFFESKGHVRISSAPLVPEHDPSVLFTTAGMHPLVPYLKGQPHPQGTRLVNVQKCLRTTDIEDVGDAVHATVFEMLGNWSLGDYFKSEAIAWSWEFLTADQWLGIDPAYLAVSVFAGDSDAPRDKESATIWGQVGVPADRIAFLDKQENWWPAGGGQPGPQGPDTEMFYWTGQGKPPRHFDPLDPRWVEIWNDVFMQYERTAQATYTPLPQQNVDTGMGLERTVMVLNGLSSIYEIDTFQPLMQLINNHIRAASTYHHRIIADHLKAATFVLGDEQSVLPANTDRGYVLRRLIRRAVRSARVLAVEQVAALLSRGAQLVVEQYQDIYPSLAQHQDIIQTELNKEVERFTFALDRGLKKFNSVVANQPSGGVIAGHDAFTLYESYGFPIELTTELATEHKLTVDRVRPPK